MENPKTPAIGESSKPITLRRVMTSFRVVPEVPEDEQFRLIRAAMEAHGLKRYQEWEVVEPYTVACYRMLIPYVKPRLQDSVKNTCHTLFRKTKKALTRKETSPDARYSASNKEPETKNDAMDEDWVILTDK